MNYLSDLKLLGKAFAEATAMEFDNELKDCKKFTSFSPSHAKRMREITGCRVISPITFKRLMIVLIAAVIFLVGCAAFIYKEEISNFFVAHFSTHNVVESNGEETSTITVEYNLTYVPEGYTIFYDQNDEFGITKRYSNNFSEVLIFEQRVNNGTKYVFDIEHNAYTIEEYDGKAIYLSEGRTSYSILWFDNGYSFYISLYSSTDKNEIFKLIDGVKPN